MAPNLDLRWLTAPGALGLLADAALVGFLAREAAALPGGLPRHPAERWLRYLSAAAALVIASAWVLSGFGQLGGRGFLLLHAAAAGLVFLWRKRRPVRSGPSPLGLPAIFGRRGLPAAAGWILAGLLAYLFLLAAADFAVNWDSQTYRLSRVGFWLQEGRVSLAFANDPRLIFMPVNTELGMLWPASFFPAGYPLVNLVQFFGGCLLLLSTWEMGRLAGFSRARRLAAVFLALGAPIVVLEFATSQADLFTAGLLNAGLAFLWRALRRRGGPDALYAGLAAGLALGAKGTVLYWGPGLALWAALLAWRERAGWRRAAAVVGLAAAVALAAGGWKYADNLRRYGNPFAPAGEIARVHQAHSPARAAEQRLIVLTHLWELLLPNSNPRFLAPLLARPQQALAAKIQSFAPDDSVRAGFQRVLQAHPGDYVFEDVVSFGLLLPLLAALGWAVDLARTARTAGSRPPARLAMAAAVAGFLAVLFHEMQLDAVSYRYLTTVVPFCALAAAAAWPAGRLGRLGGLALLGVVALQVYSVLDLQDRNFLGGWRSIASRPGSTELFERLSGQLSGADGSIRRVALALPANYWLSPYFRAGGGRHVEFLDVGALLHGYSSPAQFLAKSGCDAVLTDPALFASLRWPGTRVEANGLGGAFARVLITRQR
ncbi:MAG TPA: hypothetical protein VHC86_01025 [Opitutaceae bacterium]|nr:hypothetical protein [Opitutaceae bacterium]